jgi:hypothetical protein
VQRILKDQGVKFVEMVWQEGAVQPRHGPQDQDDADGSDDLELSDDDADASDERPAPAAAGARAADLSRDDLRKLQAALFELNECKRLLVGPDGKSD